MPGTFVSSVSESAQLTLTRLGVRLVPSSCSRVIFVSATRFEHQLTGGQTDPTGVLLGRRAFMFNLPIGYLSSFRILMLEQYQQHCVTTAK
jgi:hypothetical protein